MPTTRKAQVIMLFNQRRKNIEVIINVLSNPLKLSFLINLQCDSLTFFAAVLNASLWLISGLLALILWISSLHYHEYFIALEINDKREEKEAVRRMLIIYIYMKDADYELKSLLYKLVVCRRYSLPLLGSWAWN